MPARRYANRRATLLHQFDLSPSKAFCPCGAWTLGYRKPSVGGKPITSAVVETVLSKEIDDLEPKLTRQGYNVKALAELLNVRPVEIKAFLRSQLASGRAQELQAQMLRAGIPL